MSRFINNVVFNSVGEIGSRLPFIVTELYVAKTIGLESYGIWAVIQLFVNYNNFSHFGLLSGLAKLEPIHLPNKSQSYIEGVRSNSFYPVFILDALLVVLLVGLGADSVFGSGSEGLVWSLILLAVSQQLYLYGQIRLQNIVAFKLLSAGKLLYSLLFMIFVLYWPGELNVINLVYFWSASYALTSIFIYCKANIFPKIILNKFYFNELIIVGFPIFLMGIIKLLLISMDKLFIIKFYESDDVGIYNISLQAMLIMSVVIGLMSRVFQPVFLGMITEDSDKSKSFYETVKLNAFLGGVVIAFLCSIAFTFIIRQYLPEFELGILPGVILIFSGIYQGGVQLSITAVIAKNKEKLLLCLYLVFGLFYACVLLILVSLSLDLWIIAFSNLLFWMVLEVVISKCLLKEYLRNLLLPFAFLLISLAAGLLAYAFVDNTVVYSVSCFLFLVAAVYFLLVKSGLLGSRLVKGRVAKNE